MPITAEITNAEGFPTIVKLRDGNKRVEVFFESGVGFKINGSKRSLTPEMLELLRMIYPAQLKLAPEDVKVNVLKLLDAGKQIQAESSFAGPGWGIQVLYTVPVGKTFYLIGFDLLVNATNATLPYEGNLYFWDPAGAGTSYNIALLTVDVVGAGQNTSLHANGAFTLFRLPEGWSIRTYAANNSAIDSMITGIEI